MSMPLQGYRVIELAQIYAGPYCGLQLAHFGAEVIKIEPPGTGELLRKRPPAKHGTNYGFLMLNTGKKSVSLNLKDPRGREILFRMLADADVTSVLTAAEIERAFDLVEQLKHVDHIFDRVFVALVRA